MMENEMPVLLLFTRNFHLLAAVWFVAMNNGIVDRLSETDEDVGEF